MAPPKKKSTKRKSTADRKPPVRKVPLGTRMYGGKYANTKYDPIDEDHVLNVSQYQKSRNVGGRVTLKAASPRTLAYSHDFDILVSDNKDGYRNALNKLIEEEEITKEEGQRYADQFVAMFDDLQKPGRKTSRSSSGRVSPVGRVRAAPRPASPAGRGPVSRVGLAPGPRQTSRPVSPSSVGSVPSVGRRRVSQIGRRREGSVSPKRTGAQAPVATLPVSTRRRRIISPPAEEEET